MKKDRRKGAETAPPERGLYKMHTVARLSGFAPELLRAWELRHGFLRPLRTPTGHRLYTDADLRVLQRVRERIAGGDSIGEIAVVGRDTLLGESAAGVRLDATTRRGADAVAASSPGGTKLTEGRLARTREELVDAALALDAHGIDEILDGALRGASTEQVVQHVIRPVAVRLGELWASGRLSVASEHLATARFVTRLHNLVLAHEPDDPNAAIALVACLPDEHHELGPLVLAFHLVQSGFRLVYLGANLPFEDLERACELVDPRIVALSTTREALLVLHGPRLAEVVRRRRAKSDVWLGGAGVPASHRELEREGLELWPVTRSLAGLPKAAKYASRGGKRSRRAALTR